jgi:hypothetical protein
LRLIAVILIAAIVSASCRSVLSRKYEYDEDIYLALDGSATIYLSASVPALVALRGLDLSVDRRARLDRLAVRQMFESPVVRVANVSASRRDNRRYLHLRLEVPDINRLGEAAPFSWARYSLRRDESLLKYHQVVGAAAGRDVANVGWTGNELVAIRVHLPSRVPFHNSPSGEIQRGNIVAWEQSLAERVQGKPIDMQIHMETESILAQTLILFGLMALLVVLTFALVIWLVMRRGRAPAAL